MAGIGRSSLHYKPRGGKDQTTLVGQLSVLSARHPRYGYRRLCAMLRREGKAVIELWRRYYNTQRPHSSLRYRTPLEFRASLAKDGGHAAGGCMCSPPEDTATVQALSSDGGGLSSGAGAGRRAVPARACGS